MLRRHRPDEEVIQAALGDREGLLAFHEIADTGLSTADPEVAARHAESGAWGEWGSDQLRAALGYVPAGLAHAEGRRLPALFADYTVFGMNGHAAYIVSAVLGISLVAATVWSLLRLARAGAPAPIGEESADTL
jgi:hypothetical protein